MIAFFTRLAATFVVAYLFPFVIASPTENRNAVASRTDRIKFYEAELDRVCTAPGEQWACYKGSKLDEHGKLQSCVSTLV